MVRAGLEPGISGSQGKRPNHWATLQASIFFWSSGREMPLQSASWRILAASSFVARINRRGFSRQPWRTPLDILIKISCQKPTIHNCTLYIFIKNCDPSILIWTKIESVQSFTHEIPFKAIERLFEIYKKSNPKVFLASRYFIISLKSLVFWPMYLPLTNPV